MDIDMIKAGKHSLEAEKKTLQVRYDGVSLKLKLKTHQYDILAGQQTIAIVQSTTEMSPLLEKNR